MKNKAISYQWLNSIKHHSRHKRVSEYLIAYYIILIVLYLNLDYRSGTNYADRATQSKLLDANDRIESNQQLIALVAREKEEDAALAEYMDEEARTFQQLHWRMKANSMPSVKPSTRVLKPCRRSWKPATGSAATQRKHPKSHGTAIFNEVDAHTDRSTACFRRLGSRYRTIDLSKGARPEKGKNKAITEWPTQGKQAADYVLFAGLTPVAVVEAKRENINVAGKIPQAERYSRGFKQSPSCCPLGRYRKNHCLADYEEGHYQIPLSIPVMPVLLSSNWLSNPAPGFVMYGNLPTWRGHCMIFIAPKVAR